MERNLGEQPIARIMKEAGLSAKDLVAASGEGITFKMVTRACKGRRLTPHSQHIILNALNKAAGAAHGLGALFTYADSERMKP